VIFNNFLIRPRQNIQSLHKIFNKNRAEKTGIIHLLRRRHRSWKWTPCYDSDDRPGQNCSHVYSTHTNQVTSTLVSLPYILLKFLKVFMAPPNTAVVRWQARNGKIHTGSVPGQEIPRYVVQWHWRRIISHGRKTMQTMAGCRKGVVQHSHNCWLPASDYTREDHMQTSDLSKLRHRNAYQICTTFDVSRFKFKRKVTTLLCIRPEYLTQRCLHDWPFSRLLFILDVVDHLLFDDGRLRLYHRRKFTQSVHQRRHLNSSEQ